ncbi:MAG: T9SS type A sorting domain-containing protein [Lentimicrobium sp.]|nr:T9SS type A sorting domain-containing protein [Lentimicrobium sp.]
MQKGYLLLIILFGIQSLYGQIVPSSCNAPDSVILKYIDDADRLALYKIQRLNLPESDSIQILEIHSDSILNALIAVYNAGTIPESDTITRIYPIHTFPDYDLDVINIAANPNLAWMLQLKNRIIPTGHPEIDSLIATYQLTFRFYYDYPDHIQYDIASLRSPTNLNIAALAELFEEIPDVDYAEENRYMGDGMNIYESIASDHIQLVYYYGWGDCPSGCTYRRYYKFKVYYDCSVEFCGSYNNLYSALGSDEPNSKMVSIFPNPFEDLIRVNGFTEPFKYRIANIAGQIVSFGISDRKEIGNIAHLKPGLYFLSVQTENLFYTFKIIKR